jgi:hypothetical protein
MQEMIRAKLEETVSHCKFKRAWLPKGWACVEIRSFAKDLANDIRKEVMEMARGNAGRGRRGACGGTRRRDGSGGGKGNRGTKRQPKK